MTAHVWSEKHKMRRGHNAGAPITYCRECKGSGASLTTHCAVRQLTDKEEAEVAAGALDFVSGQWVRAQPDTKHLDTALEILKGKPGSRRARGTTFTLYADQGILQGPRGKTVATFHGTPEECTAKAQAHVSRIPGATLTIFE